MAAVDEPGTMENHDLVAKTEAMNLEDGGAFGHEGEETVPNGLMHGEHLDAAEDEDVADEAHETGGAEPEPVPAGLNGDATSVRTRPTIHDEPSRSYIKPIPIVTTYEPEIADNASVNKRNAGSVRAPSMKQSVKAPSVRALPAADSVRAPSRAASVRQPMALGRPESIRSTRPESVRPPSMKPSVRRGQDSNRYSGMTDGAMSGAAVGDVLSSQRQREMQQSGAIDQQGVSLVDQGPVSRNRPMSPFGHRPQPNLMAATEDGRESRTGGRDSREGLLNRSGTVISRANTLGRNNSLSRAANGGTVGSRRGAFGRGAGASVGTQPEEVLGRDDIHTRAELSERILDDTTLRRLSNMERKDAMRLSKVIQGEGKAEAQAVKGSIKELERLSRLQKDAAGTERRSQLRLSKWTSKEHKARLRFLKEKERYEKIEGELRNAENDYEERRDHAAGLTAQVAEKTQELDDLRGQKAADDRERAVKLLALKNPAHS